MECGAESQDAVGQEKYGTEKANALGWGIRLTYVRIDIAFHQSFTGLCSGTSVVKETFLCHFFFGTIEVYFPIKDLLQERWLDI